MHQQACSRLAASLNNNKLFSMRTSHRRRLAPGQDWRALCMHAVTTIRGTGHLHVLLSRNPPQAVHALNPGWRALHQRYLDHLDKMSNSSFTPGSNLLGSPPGSISTIQAHQCAPSYTSEPVAAAVSSTGSATSYVQGVAQSNTDRTRHNLPYTGHAQSTHSATRHSAESDWHSGCSSSSGSAMSTGEDDPWLMGEAAPSDAGLASHTQPAEVPSGRGWQARPAFGENAARRQPDSASLESLRLAALASARTPQRLASKFIARHSEQDSEGELPAASTLQAERPRSRSQRHTQATMLAPTPRPTDSAWPLPSRQVRPRYSHEGWRQFTQLQPDKCVLARPQIMAPADIFELSSAGAIAPAPVQPVHMAAFVECTPQARAARQAAVLQAVADSTAALHTVPLEGWGTPNAPGSIYQLVQDTARSWLTDTCVQHGRSRITMRGSS